MTDGTLIVRPDCAQAQRAAEVPEEPAPSGGPALSGDGPVLGPSGEAVPPPAPPPPGKTRFFSSKRLQSERLATDFKKLVDEVLGPLGVTAGVTLSVTVAEVAADLGCDLACRKGRRYGRSPWRRTASSKRGPGT